MDIKTDAVGGGRKNTLERIRRLRRAAQMRKLAGRVTQHLYRIQQELDLLGQYADELRDMGDGVHVSAYKKKRKIAALSDQARSGSGRIRQTQGLRYLTD